ncbi:hypothetical protein F5X99DRAFT_262858 [Biscogniauxia marginata]|nr:hypothetical protein F5X99DRAFT_262858 [Biscogniauxia marginata]
MPGVTISPTPRGHREPDDYHPHLAGCIKWLPPKEELKIADKSIEDGGYNHPIVILSPQPQDGKVTMLIMTSFRGLDLKTKFQNNLRLRDAYLPIEPCEAHPDNGILLRLRDRSLRKNSYVNTQTQCSILLTSLRPYERQSPDYFLSSDSYRELAGHAKFIAPVPHPRAGSITSSLLPSTAQQLQTQTQSQPRPQRVTTTATHHPVRPVIGWDIDDYDSAVDNEIRRAREAANERARQQRALQAQREARIREHNVEVQARIQADRERLPLLAAENWDYPYRAYRDHPAYARPSSPNARWTTGAVPTAAASHGGGDEPESVGCGMVLKLLFKLGMCILAAYGMYRGYYWVVGVGQKASQAASIFGGKIQDVWWSKVDRWLQLFWDHERY